MNPGDRVLKANRAFKYAEGRGANDLANAYCRSRIGKALVLTLRKEFLASGTLRAFDSYSFLLQGSLPLAIDDLQGGSPNSVVNWFLRREINREVLLTYGQQPIGSGLLFGWDAYTLGWNEGDISCLIFKGPGLCIRSTTDDAVLVLKGPMVRIHDTVDLAA